MSTLKSRNNSLIQVFIKKAPDSRFFGPDTGLIRLNHNEMTGLLPSSFVTSLLKNKNILSTYPSYDELHKIISSYIGTPKRYVQVVNGSDDAIPKLIRILFNNAKSVILPVPVFPTYERALKIEDISITEIPYIEESNQFAFPLDAVKKAIRSKTNQGLVICNPSNPLGSGIDKKTLASLISETKNAGIPLIVDEAYFEFFGVSAVSTIKNNPHVIVLRTFSKTFGLAGLRIGYVVANPTVIEALKKLILPWEVNHVAVNAAIAVLRLKKHFYSELKKTRTRALALQKMLRQFNLHVFDTFTNFIVFRAERSEFLFELLEKEGVIVRPLSYATQQLPSLYDCIRISVPGPDIEKKAFRKIKSALTKYQTL